MSAELTPAKDVQLSSTPSIMYNNLTTLGDSYVYAHQHELITVRPLGPHKIPLDTKEKHQVTSVAGGLARGKPLALMSTNAETQLWDSVKDIKMASIVHGAEAEVRGVAMMESGEHLFVAVGHSSGEVEFFQVNPDFSVQSIKRQKAHRGAITCITTVSPGMTFASGLTFASGDTSGELVLWNAQFASYVAVPSASDCVSSIALLPQGLVAAGYGSGTIKLFAGDSGAQTVEIGAHSRWINAISYDMHSNRLASVSEDNLVCVWGMPSATSGNVVFLGHKVHPNRLPTGCAWSQDGKQLLVSLYDTDKMVVYQMA